MDTFVDGWDAHFTRCRQTGRETGNDELEDYVPENVQIRGTDCFLVLERRSHGTSHGYASGKIRSRRNLAELCPNGGVLEVTAQGPNPRVQGLWSAIWLLGPGAWPGSGECDLHETMFFRGDEQHAFSTLHFGAGRDFVHPGAWGLHLGNYPWDAGDHTLRFEWRRSSGWDCSLAVDGRHVWSFNTRRLPADEPGFREGEGGCARAIFERAFEDPNHGLFLICNLAYGGRPFRHVADVSIADFAIRRVRVSERCA